VALLAAAEAGVAVRSFTPTVVKLAVAGHGGASKDAVARMVAAQLRLSAPPDPADVADALAVAICHLSRSPLAAAAAEGSRSDWSSVLDRPHIRVAGGTGDPP
jgi:crossover junction endodeoxyribonuclease RuvC